MISDHEAHQALVNSLALITETPAEYRTAIEPSNIRDVYDAEWLASDDPALYPKIGVWLNGGRDIKRPNYQLNRILSFTVTFVGRKTGSDRSLAVKAGDWVHDLRKRLMLDSTLGGNVHEARFESYLTDGGVLAPECAVTAVVEVELMD